MNSKVYDKSLTQWDLHRADLALGVFRFLSPLRKAVAYHIANSRRQFANEVAATCDEFGEDFISSAMRLSDLLRAELAGEDPSTFKRFRWGVAEDPWSEDEITYPDPIQPTTNL